MNILHISDTHSLHSQLQELPKADVLVHSGDFTFAGTENEAMDFLRWFCGLPYPYKVLIAGNHDDCFYGANIDGLPDNCYYLNGSGVTIEGVRFYGIPMFMENDIKGDYEKMLHQIPLDTEVLITHQPPFGILDLGGKIHFGSKVLKERMKELNLKTHLFGHIHAAYGCIEKDGVVYSNAALVGDNYMLEHLPRVISI